MSRGTCGDTSFSSRFALPAAPDAAAWREALARAGLTAARARAASHLGDPDPFPARRVAWACDPTAPVVLTDASGVAPDPDRIDAALVEAALQHPEAADWLGAVLGGRRAPAVRAVPVDLPPDHPVAPWLRYVGHQPPAPRLGQPVWVPAVTLGAPEVATVRALLGLSDGRLAAGTDYGLALFDGTSWTPFEFPDGARREARRVEAMAEIAGELVVATARTTFRQVLPDGPVRPVLHARDEDGVADDVRSLLAWHDSLLIGWRRGLEGASGLPETLSLTTDPEGVAWGGTLYGEVYVVGEPVPVRRFEAGGKGRPVRHAAGALGALWFAASGALHRFDGATWSERAGESTALARDPAGRLWSIRDGRVAVSVDGDRWPEPLDLPVERPWALGFAQQALWVGAVGGLLRVPLEPT